MDHARPDMDMPPEEAFELWWEVDRRLTIVQGPNWHGGADWEWGLGLGGRLMVRAGSSCFCWVDGPNGLLAEVVGGRRRHIDADGVVVDPFHPAGESLT
jgi:hypothetical protein